MSLSFFGSLEPGVTVPVGTLNSRRCWPPRLEFAFVVRQHNARHRILRPKFQKNHIIDGVFTEPGSFGAWILVMRRRASSRSGAASSCAGRDWIRSICSASGGPNEECGTTTSSNDKPFTAYALVPHRLWHPSPERVTVPALARVTRPDGLAIRLPDRVR